MIIGEGIMLTVKNINYHKQQIGVYNIKHFIIFTILLAMEIQNIMYNPDRDHKQFGVDKPAKYTIIIIIIIVAKQ